VAIPEVRRRRGRRVVALTATLATALGVVGVVGASSHAATPHTTGAHAARDRVAVVTGDPRVDRLLAKMTLDEKLSMLEGQQEAAATNQDEAGFLPGVPRLGIPSLRLTDGPPGVATKVPSTGMPDTMAVAATFSGADARANGTVIGRDARALGQDVVLEPFVNIDRDPTWTRGYNTFGEDPLLTGQTGAAEIRGIQSQGVMAQVKHYIAYDGANNVTVDAQTLHEIYLQPFQDAVNAGVASVMCSYNMVGGEQSCDNHDTLSTILRGQLGFKGFVTSDWGANHSTDSLNAGTDLEMPGGGGGLATYFDRKSMLAALKAGTITMAGIDRAVGRILYEMDRFGLLTGHSKHTVTPAPTAADDRVIEGTAQDAAVLLKNSGQALPLRADALGSTAVIGPGGGQLISTGVPGEKGRGLLAQQQSPRSALEQATGRRVRYAVGDDLTGTVIPASALSHDGKPGLSRVDTRTGATSVDATVDFTGAHALPAGDADTWTGTLTVPATGTYSLDLQLLGAGGQLTLDGRTVDSTGFVGMPQLGYAPRYGTLGPEDSSMLPTTDGLDNVIDQQQLTKGRHTISVSVAADASHTPLRVRLAWVTPAHARAAFDTAVATAARARTAVVFAYSSGSLDQPLPDGQDALIAAIAKVNPDTIVVLNTGEPVAMPWLGKVRAVLEMWYPGDKGGVATANLLLGRADPSGRLPFTWPASLAQGVATNPAHPERAGNGVLANGTPCTAAQATGFRNGGMWINPACQTTYSEGIDVGYRFFDAEHETPLFPFGYGLSYTAFGYSRLRAVRAADGGLDVTFTVTNTGHLTGTAVPQIYLGAPSERPAGVRFAAAALAGYQRVTLRPGQSARVTVWVPVRQLQYWNTAGDDWRLATGLRTVQLSSSERNTEISTLIRIR
jgi:beta-glucosidase